jgi:hypothetical protein
MIHNIHILTEPVSESIERANQVRAVQEQLLIEAHRRGEHPLGSMRRECPLCQLNK